MAKTLCTVLFVAVVWRHPLAQTALHGEIAGRITDIQGMVLSGARITVSGSDEAQEAITDASGHFVVGALKLGTYRVVAALPGFISASSSLTLSPRTRRAQIEWPLELGCLVEVQRVLLGLREEARMAETIVHLRVTSDRGSVLLSTRPGCDGSVMQAYSVDVLKAVPVRVVKKDALTEIRMSAEDRGLTVGGEYLALLGPDGAADEWSILPIASGRLTAAARELRGMRVEDALETLRTWSRQRRR